MRGKSTKTKQYYEEPKVKLNKPKPEWTTDFTDYSKYKLS
jgi:hypothetical protein